MHRTLPREPNLRPDISRGWGGSKKFPDNYLSFLFGGQPLFGPAQGGKRTREFHQFASLAAVGAHLGAEFVHLARVQAMLPRIAIATGRARTPFCRSGSGRRGGGLGKNLGTIPFHTRISPIPSKRCFPVLFPCGIWGLDCGFQERMRAIVPAVTDAPQFLCPLCHRRSVFR